MKKLIKLGNIINDKSQCGCVYSPLGIANTLCACTHGWANGYIAVLEEDNDSKNRMCNQGESRSE